MSLPNLNIFRCTREETLRKQTETETLTLQELQVVFYGSMNCPYCRQTKDLLEDNGSWDIIE